MVVFREALSKRGGGGEGGVCARICVCVSVYVCGRGGGGVEEFETKRKVAGGECMLSYM